MSDEPGWITKREAATLAEVDERTIERKARAGKITSRGRPGFPTRYWQADVELLRQTAAGEVQTGILEAVPAASSNGHGASAALQPRASSIEALIVEVLQAVRGALTAGPIGPTGPTAGPTGPTAAPLYLDVEQAAAYLNWTLRDLRRAIRQGDVPCRNKERRDWRTWRIKRTDVEAL